MTQTITPKLCYNFEEFLEEKQILYYNNSFTNHGLNFCGFDEKVSKIHKLVANDPIKTICYYKLQFTDH